MDDVTPLRKPRPGRPDLTHRGRLIVLGLAVLVVLVVALVIFLRYYVDWLWFGEVALRTVFWRRIATSAVVGPIFAVVLSTSAPLRPSQGLE